MFLSNAALSLLLTGFCAIITAIMIYLNKRKITKKN